MLILQSKVSKLLSPLQKKIIVLFICVVSCMSVFTLMTNSVFADNPSSTDYVETTYFGNLEDDGKGCGVFSILNLIIDNLSIGIGILGVIGIMVAGIQYLSAKDNNAQTQKAKRRLGEIVIGLVVFSILYVFAQWLLPSGKLSNDTKCRTISSEDLAEIKEAEQKAKEAENNNSNNTNNNNNSSTNSNRASDDTTDSGSSSSDSKSTVRNTAPYLKETKFNRECLRNSNLTTTGEKIACILNTISKWADENNVHYGNKAWRGKNTLMNCATFTSAAYIEAGLLKRGDYFAMWGNDVLNWKEVKKRHTLAKTDVPDGIKIKTLVKQGKMFPGDTIGLAHGHTYMYVGKNKAGKHTCQELGRSVSMKPLGNGNYGPHQHKSSKFECGNRSVYMIVHPKRNITISL